MCKLLLWGCERYHVRITLVYWQGRCVYIYALWKTYFWLLTTAKRTWLHVGKWEMNHKSGKAWKLVGHTMVPWIPTNCNATLLHVTGLDSTSAAFWARSKYFLFFLVIAPTQTAMSPSRPYIKFYQGLSRSFDLVLKKLLLESLPQDLRGFHRVSYLGMLVWRVCLSLLALNLEHELS